MAVFRFLAAVFLLIATIAIVVDATPPVYGAGSFTATSLAAHWHDLGATSYEAAKSTVSRFTAPWVWTGVIETILAIPTFIAFGLLALFSGYLGRRRKTVRVFVNEPG